MVANAFPALPGRQLLSANEALARGAWEYGVAVVSGYPGTPSTEIIQALSRFPSVYAEWAPNEKVAMDVVVGASYVGRRALTAAKCVGINVAADALFYASVTGVVGGLVVVTADDPGQHSSQDEQDNRRYGPFARIPVLEPTDSQEAKEIVGEALALSERFRTPVLIRVTTRLAHGSSVVTLGSRQEQQRGVRFPRDPRQYNVLFDREKRYPLLEERVRGLAEYAEESPWNRIEPGDPALGIIACGIAYQYGREVFPGASFLKLGMTYPLPEKLVQRFAQGVKRLLVLEELDPFVEEQVRLLGVRVEGKSIFPSCGELSPDLVYDGAARAGLLPPRKRPEVIAGLPPRPPVLCAGCPHRAFFYVAGKLGVVIHGDIGCYTLGALPPLQAMDSCGCMGSSIGVAHGAVRAGSPERHVAVIGDSTFLHSGIQSLLNVVHNGSSVVVVILDNRSTAMTGYQDTSFSDYTLQGRPARRLEFEPLVRALGIEQVTTVDAYDLGAIKEALRRDLAGDGPAVLVVRRECVKLTTPGSPWPFCFVDTDRCNGCHLCLQLGCPAIGPIEGKAAGLKAARVQIDLDRCVGCGLCSQVCGQGAISRVEAGENR